MTKASKGLCATITPSAYSVEKLTSYVTKRHFPAQAQKREILNFHSAGADFFSRLTAAFLDKGFQGQQNLANEKDQGSLEFHPLE